MKKKIFLIILLCFLCACKNNSSTLCNISSKSITKSQEHKTVLVDDESFYYELSSSNDFYILSGVKDKYQNVVNIPNSYKGLSVKEIAENFLKDNEYIEEVIFGDNIERVNDYAFYNCKNLKKVILSDSIKYVGDMTFRDCQFLILNEENGLKYLGTKTNNYFLAYNYSLSSNKDIIFNDETRIIGSLCFTFFKNQLNQETIHIPKNVYYIAEKAFFYSMPFNIIVDNDNKFYDSRNECGSIVNTKNNCLTFSSLSTIVDDSIESVGDYCFFENDNIEEIDLKNVKSIGEYSFFGCSALKTINCSNIKSVPDYAFANCTNLENFNFENINYIGKYSFYNCSSLTNIDFNSDVKIIDDSALRSCINISSIVGTSNIEFVGNYAFSGCVRLEDISFSNSITHIGTKAFLNCPSLVELNIPSSVVELGTHIVSLASSTLINVDEKNYFIVNADIQYLYDKDFNLLTINKLIAIDDEIEICVPSFIKTIENYVFESDSLSILGDVLSTPSVISNCIKNIALPEGLTKIGDYAFSNLKIENILVPNTVEEIGIGAFNGCINLKEIIINDGVTRISKYIFNDCKSLNSISIPDTVEYIDDYAFYNCSSLININVPKNLKYIGDYAFYKCEIEEFDLSDSIEFIGDYAFNYSKITNAYIGKNVSHIGICPFLNTSLSNIEVNEENLNYTSYDSNLIYDIKENKIIEGLSDSIIPSNTEIIGKYAFAYTNNLKTIEIPNSLRIIDDFGFAFSGIAMKELNLNNVSWIGDSILLKTKINKVIISSNIQSIKPDDFVIEYLYLYIPKSVKYICGSVIDTNISYILYEGSEEDWSNILFLSTIPDYIYYFDGPNAGYRSDDPCTLYFGINVSDVLSKVRYNK